MNDETQTDRPILQDVVPVLAVVDLKRSLNFYCDLLGFEVGWQWGEPANLASVCRDKVELNLAVREAGEINVTKVYVVVDQVDFLYKTWTARGLKVRNEISDQEYGMRDFDFADPDGNLLCVGEST
jgi:catechol 2,3-dioxygenase-like lactoylglutathione lyase family enzyme